MQIGIYALLLCHSRIKITEIPQLSSSSQNVPHVVITMGLHGSGSTWVFNIARELVLATVGAEAMVSGFSATPAALLAHEGIVGRHLVCKTHGWQNLHVFAYLSSAVVVVTVRDPRDCVVSLIERFKETFPRALGGLAQECLHASACADLGAVVLRYEDRFFDDPAVVRTLARHIGVEVSETVASAIFDRYRTEAVRAFAATVSSLPRERLEGDGKPLLFDRVTHITNTHIGDGLIGKWRERTDPQQQSSMAQHFAGFLARFDYQMA